MRFPFWLKYSLAIALASASWSLGAIPLSPSEHPAAKFLGLIINQLAMLCAGFLLGRRNS